MVKFPSKSVETPLVVPFSTMLTPGIGIFELSNTVPVTVPWANATVEQINATANIKIRVVLFIINKRLVLKSMQN